MGAVNESAADLQRISQQLDEQSTEITRVAANLEARLARFEV